MPFTALGLEPRITKAVHEAGYTEPTPIQTKAIPTVLAGRDVIGSLPAMRRIVNALPKKRQTLMFSATLSKEIETLTGEMLTHPEIVQVGRRANPAETVTQFVIEVKKEHKLGLLQHLLLDQKLDSVLVFSRTKHGAD